MHIILHDAVSRRPHENDRPQDSVNGHSFIHIVITLFHQVRGGYALQISVDDPVQARSQGL